MKWVRYPFDHDGGRMMALGHGDYVYVVGTWRHSRDMTVMQTIGTTGRRTLTRTARSRNRRS